jgi:hypothetical protein
MGEGGEVKEKIEGQQYTSIVPSYTVKNANRIPGFPWNLSFLIRENTHCG